MPKDERIRLLIAEDEQMLRNGLAGLDWKAQEITLLPTAKNGLQAVEIATEHTVDILLTDIRMPGCSGIEVAGFVRERYPQAEILFLSGYEEFDYAQKAISLRANNYILKPVMPREVLRAVGAAREAIRQRRADEEARHQMRTELQILTRVASAAQGPAGETDAPTEEEITLVVSYIHKHYQEPLSLACLAEVFHFTPVYLSRLIKKKSGHTFTELLTSTRMYHAARLLRETTLKNGEICTQIGMSDERYFTQVFLRTYGVPHQQYRKQHRREKPLFPPDGEDSHEE